MSRHLLLVALGPVQEFIAQARRTRDLWFGSHVLSELSRAAAKELAEKSAHLIFPALDLGIETEAAELQPCDEPLRPAAAGGERKPPISIANKILAVVSDGADPKGLAVAARTAVMRRWTEWADGIREDRSGLLASDIDEVWDEQIDDVVEFYAVWAPLGANDYGAVRKRVESALAGRKGLRDFRPITKHRDGAPKSSLDGARVSILAKNRTHPDFAKYRIGPGEQLDSVGVVKRTGGKPEQFVPIMNVTAGVWLEHAAKDPACCRLLQELSDACGEIGIGRVERPNMRVAQAFGFDASVLYPSRWPSLFEELRQPADAAARGQAHENGRTWGERNVGPLLEAMRDRGLSAPPSYVACLVADGDGMGEAINDLNEPDQNQEFSRALAAFPIAARDIVERDHLGSLVYSGGDDVLAFLPVATAVQCAAALAKKFKEILDQQARSLPFGRAPTLSAGIGVGHVLESMGALLELGREAERAAKANHGKNSLAVIVDKRSGGRVQFVEKWDAQPLERLFTDARLIGTDRDGPEGAQFALSIGKIHEIGDIFRRFPEPKKLVGYAETAATTLRAYVDRALRQSGAVGEEDGERQRVTLADLGLALETEQNYAVVHGALERLVGRLLVAKALQDSGFGREAPR